MPEGVDYINYQGKKITRNIAERNFLFWKKKIGIPETFTKEFNETLEMVKKVHGAHTFPNRIVDANMNVIYPILSIFGFNKKTSDFNPSSEGIISHSKRTVNKTGDHLKTLIDLGLDKFVFSYLGAHTPYQRTSDLHPIFPFGVFVKPSIYAITHGSPCDVTYDKNPLVNKDEIDKYFLLPEHLHIVITQVIMTEKLFNANFWDYFGNPEIWSENYSLNHWKHKGEYRFFEKMKPESITSILWPVWESIIEDNKDFSETMTSFLDIRDAFLRAFPKINVILYRPYGDEINENAAKNWDSRDWERNLVEASYIAKMYYIKFGNYPESIKIAKQILIT